MAIKQQIVNVSGAITEYHRISEAVIDFTKREATVIVLSYLDSTKRDEEKTQANNDAGRDAIMQELNELVANATPDNEARRNELSDQLNAMPLQTPEDVEPRNISMARYMIAIPQNVDFTLAFAYGWLKENVYTNSEDV